MKGYVVDASAVLAFFNREPGADRVQAILQSGEGVITAVNLAEVAGKFIGLGMPPPKAEGLCRSLELPVLEVDARTAYSAAALAPFGLSLGLSLGDRVCLAAALLEGRTALTADRAWTKVPGIPTELIR
jgi:PIN domain nuclease of toxin-antitoxin system